MFSVIWPHYFFISQSIIKLKIHKEIFFSLTVVFPALENNEEIIDSGRTLTVQALYQLLGIGTSLAIAILGGLITGWRKIFR